ncbi:A/G-specific adenine glycosylase [Corynebacterium felinum]|uniref:Adenine DNA glycosylase n=1 Tax=Corynebacterium felinum TaxID=131318 RepID=A0ABU2B700_9CORY|nr:A/G-specific adenine glycosylase [Corynebacterium felinum]MDF5821453.1 A/G-specific adenine glycosylase [Corynebacterium felinum]MDR7353804.1 A/G-specific adenine glycosylase [Corynebacterium felinum]WJY95983.1 A/G-specific adenine glycosylase [Corynebacterium felinum]
MTHHSFNTVEIPALNKALSSWYQANARTIAWRTPATSPWGILLSEVMSQQTPVNRVEPAWREWMNTWPTPAALADAPTADVVKAWGSLGYPRRALRLKECASAITTRHGGKVPDTLEELLALPGIGQYTASAVAAFAFGQRVPVIDTNVRRVVRRILDGRYLVRSNTTTKKDLAQVEQLLPQQGAPLVSVALMELGALICRPAPLCEQCPVQQLCTWQQLGCPKPSAEEVERAKGRVQKFHGTDRQVRGKIMHVLRTATEPVPRSELAQVWPDAAQFDRCLFSLVEDGLAEHTKEKFHLPA